MNWKKKKQFWARLSLQVNIWRDMDLWEQNQIWGCDPNQVHARSWVCSLSFLQRIRRLLSTGDHKRLIANHFWRASCNKTHILTLVSSLLESLRAYDHLGQHDSCLLFLYAYLFSLQLDLSCRLSVQPLAVQMITLLAPNHSSMLDVSLLTHLWAGSDHSKPNQAHWISEGSIQLKSGTEPHSLMSGLEKESHKKYSKSQP